MHDDAIRTYTTCLTRHSDLIEYNILRDALAASWLSMNGSLTQVPQPTRETEYRFLSELKTKQKIYNSCGAQKYRALKLFLEFTRIGALPLIVCWESNIKFAFIIRPMASDSEWKGKIDGLVGRLSVDEHPIDRCQCELICNARNQPSIRRKREFMFVRHSLLLHGNKYVSIRSKLWNNMLWGAHQNLCSGHFTAIYSIFRIVRHNQIR